MAAMNSGPSALAASGPHHEAGLMINHTIVFGDDDSVAADVAWLWINSHEWPGWRVEIIHAFTPASVKASTKRPELHEWTPDHPRRAFRDARFAGVVDLRIDEDPRVALSRQRGLLVVGHRGPGLAKALHLGSTEEWLLAHPPAPMLIARHGCRTQSALVCHDGSPHAWAAIRALHQLPWIESLNVTVLGVDDGRADVSSAVGEAAELLSGVGAYVIEDVCRGEPTNVLLEEIDRRGPDLVVMGTQGLTGLKRLTLGSTAGAIAHSTDHSLLLACADSDIELSPS